MHRNNKPMKASKIRFEVPIEDGEMEQAINSLPARMLKILKEDMQTALKSRLEVLSRNVAYSN